MSIFIRTLNSKLLPVLWGIGFLFFGLLFPSIFTRGYIYAGMLVGYLETKLQWPSLLHIVFGYQVRMSYFSLIYDFLPLSIPHYGLTIIGINMVYWITLAIVVYGLLRRYGKPAAGKTVFASLLFAGTMIYLVGTAVIYLNFKNILSDTVCCQLW